MMSQSVVSRRFASAALLSILACGAAKAAPVPVVVGDAWLRAVAAGGNGAGYAIIVNHGRFADTLIGISSPDAAAATLHESRMIGGVMTMRPLAVLAIPAGGSVALKPSGLHLMLQGVTRELRNGDQIAVVLTFAKAGRVRAKFHVRAAAAIDPMAGMKM